jgi:hypothetical protein
MTDFRSTNLPFERVIPDARSSTGASEHRRQLLLARAKIDMMHEHCLTETNKPEFQEFAALHTTSVVRFGPIRPRLTLAFDTHKTAPIELTSPELDAILAGIFAGEVVLEHARRSGVLKLFVMHAHSSSAEPRLEALRAYAELRRVILPDDRRLPSDSLSAAGFTDAQIINFDSIIVAWPEG